MVEKSLAIYTTLILSYQSIVSLETNINNPSTAMSTVIRVYIPNLPVT